MAVPPTVIGGETITSEWGNSIKDWATAGEVDGSVEVPIGPALSASFADVATVTLTIPPEWVTWTCAAHATFAATAPIGMRIRIDGTDQAQSTAGSGGAESGAVGGRRTGLVTTGARSVSLRAANSVGAGEINSIYLYARAVRTS